MLPSRPLTIPSLLTLPTLCPNLTRHFPTSAPQPPRPSRVPLPQGPQRLPVTRPRPPPVVPPVRTTSAVIDPPGVLETSLGSPTPDPEPPVTIPASSAPRPNRLSLASAATRKRLCPSSSSPALTTPPPGQAVLPSMTRNKIIITKNGSIQNSDSLTGCVEIHPCPLTPPLTTPAVVALVPVGKGLSRQTPTSPSLFSSPMLSASYHQPCIHPPTNRKATMWSLSIRKHMIITGDSNLARIPKRKMDDIQIDSFPGATLRHLTAILQKHTSPRSDTKLILLSIGINNCLRQQTAITIIKDTRRLIRTARETFPQARIAIPLITVSIRLSATQLRCVKSFNDFVRENIEDVDSRAGYLNTLSTLKFQTVHDNIHWTPETAKSMLDDWLTQLDL